MPSTKRQPTKRGPFRYARTFKVNLDAAKEFGFNIEHATRKPSRNTKAHPWRFQ